MKMMFEARWLAAEVVIARDTRGLDATDSNAGITLMAAAVMHGA